MFGARGRWFLEEASRQPALEAGGKWRQAYDLMPQRACWDAGKAEQQIQSIAQQGSGAGGGTRALSLRHDNRVLFSARPCTVRAALVHVDVLGLSSAGEQRGPCRGVNPAPSDAHSRSQLTCCRIRCPCLIPGASKFTSLAKDCLLPNKLIATVISVGWGSGEEPNLPGGEGREKSWPASRWRWLLTWVLKK